MFSKTKKKDRNLRPERISISHQIISTDKFFRCHSWFDQNKTCEYKNYFHSFSLSFLDYFGNNRLRNQTLRYFFVVSTNKTLFTVLSLLTIHPYHTLKLSILFATSPVNSFSIDVVINDFFLIVTISFEQLFYSTSCSFLVFFF